MNITTTHPRAHAAADRLAAATARPCPPIRDLVGTTDIEAAYAVQQLLTDQRVGAGGTITGRKIGLTSPAVQQQLGVDQPDFGVLFADMDVTGLPEVPSGRSTAISFGRSVPRVGLDWPAGCSGIRRARSTA